MEFDLHPECQKVLEYLRQNTTSMSTKINVDDIKRAHFERTKVLGGGSDQPFNGTRKEYFVPSSDVDGGIPVFIYNPSNPAKDPAILIHFHGGGLVCGTRHNSDPACKSISSTSGCVVVNVEYRLGPEHMFPAMFDDGATVVNWVRANKSKIGGSEASKVGVGGDSGGGAIAASLAHDMSLDFQVLIYPAVLKRGEYTNASMERYKNGPLLTRDRMNWFKENAIPHGEESNPRLASILRTKFDHLSPAIVIIAEHDPHRDGSWMYANKMKEHGVQVEVHELKRAIHAFFSYAAYCPTLCQEAYTKISNFVKGFNG